LVSVQQQQQQHQQQQPVVAAAADLKPMELLDLLLLGSGETLTLDQRSLTQH
jgi:hypothetical protein